MTLHLSIPKEGKNARIAVIGVGGGGGNAVSAMVKENMGGVKLIAANTDVQMLSMLDVPNRLRLGPELTQGLGAGSDPDVGKRAAEEVAATIREELRDLHMVFIAAGMGGGTGTGAAPVIARIAREMEVLTVCVVTTPFAFEGAQRRAVAQKGLEELAPLADTLIVTANQNLFKVMSEDASMIDAFARADQVLVHGVRGVVDLMLKPGQVNLDFADIRKVMLHGGTAQMGSGEAKGPGRASGCSPKCCGQSVAGKRIFAWRTGGGYQHHLLWYCWHA